MTRCDSGMKSTPKTETQIAAALAPKKKAIAPSPLLGRCDDRAMATEMEPARW